MRTLIAASTIPVAIFANGARVAGTGVADLSLDAMAAIDHVFLTHAHLDHVTCVPFLLDSVASRRVRPLTVHAQEATLATLRAHLFNNALWPDFTAIPSPEKPYLRFELLAPGESVALGPYHASFRPSLGLPYSLVCVALGATAVLFCSPFG